VGISALGAKGIKSSSKHQYIVITVNIAPYRLSVEWLTRKFEIYLPHGNMRFLSDLELPVAWFFAPCMITMPAKAILCLMGWSQCCLPKTGSQQYIRAYLHLSFFVARLKRLTGSRIGANRESQQRFILVSSALNALRVHLVLRVRGLSCT